MQMQKNFELLSMENCMNEDANTVQTELEKKRQRLKELRELREKLVGFRDVISKIGSIC